jgi:hypothetical protein
VSQRNSFLRDRRGAVAFETLIVYQFLLLSVLLPLAALAAAGFQFISAWQALRDFGQYLQYQTPPNITAWSGWAATLPYNANSSYPINSSNFTVNCGDQGAGASKPCSASNTAYPRYYSYSTTIIPVLWASTFCPSTGCVLQYSERFQ